MDYVKRVRAARGAVNLSLEKFADAIGVGRSTLVRIEGGNREPELDEYKAMARVSGLPLEFFTVSDLTLALSGETPPPDVLEAVRDDVRELRDAIALLSAADLRLQRELEALRAADRSTEPPADPGRG